MPEIVECFKLAKDLDDLWVGRKVVRIENLTDVPLAKFVNPISARAFLDRIENFTVQKVFRYGKNILLLMSSGYLWHIHLSSAGWLKQVKSVEQKQVDLPLFLHSVSPSSYRLRITLNDGQEWAYSDSRALGKFMLRHGPDPMSDSYIASFGPDWITDSEAELS